MRDRECERLGRAVADDVARERHVLVRALGDVLVSQRCQRRNGESLYTFVPVLTFESGNAIILSSLLRGCCTLERKARSKMATSSITVNIAIHDEKKAKAYILALLEV